MYNVNINLERRLNGLNADFVRPRLGGPTEPVFAPVIRSLSPIEQSSLEQSSLGLCVFVKNRFFDKIRMYGNKP